MISPTVTETTPRPQAVTPDSFIASGCAGRTDSRAAAAAAVVPFVEALRR